MRVEYAYSVDYVHHDGTIRTEWKDIVFTGLPTGIRWHITPIEPADGGWQIATTRVAYGGHQALLPTVVTSAVPGAPPIVDIHDQDPHTGRRRLT